MERPPDLILADATLDRRLGRWDISIVGDRVATVVPAGGGAVEAERIDVDGALVLPGLVDAHVHLDKSYLGSAWIPHRPGGSVRERIALEKDIRRDAVEPVAVRARRLAEHVSRRGTTHLRSHVDIDDEVGLAGLEALLDLRAAMADRLDIQIVAFPQSGVVTHPGAAELLDEALRLGADLVGGLDPAGYDGDVEGQLDVVFGLAERHGVGVDIHLHDGGETGCDELRRIAARTRAAGLDGRVTVSHAYALGQEPSLSEGRLARTIAALAEAGVRIMTNGPGPDTIPPVRRLLEAGVGVVVGSDNIRDAWSPFGDGDMLARARLVGYRAGLLTDDDLRRAFGLVSTESAALLGFDARFGPEPGAQADLIAVRARHLPEAVAGEPRPRELVLKRGRVVARCGEAVPA